MARPDAVECPGKVLLEWVDEWLMPEPDAWLPEPDEWLLEPEE